MQTIKSSCKKLSPDCRQILFLHPAVKRPDHIPIMLIIPWFAYAIGLISG